jgi:ABC-type Zn uptake system ZnuABC Zn-binding protein ZnuA
MCFYGYLFHHQLEFGFYPQSLQTQSEEKTMPQQRLLKIIENIAKGHYSDEIMELTSQTTPEPARTIAEAVGMMMVKIETREYQLELMVAELKELNQAIKNNTIATVSTMASALAARDTYT